MSRGSCIVTKKAIKEAIGVIENGGCGKGKSIDLALTYLEDAFMRIDMHMRENGWVTPTTNQTSAVPQSQVFPPGSIMPETRPKPQIVPRKTNGLVPAPNIPQLNRGLGVNAPVPNKAAVASNRAVSEVMEDISLLD